MKDSWFLQICAWVDHGPVAAAELALSTPAAVLAVAIAAPLTICVIAICALAWRSIGMSSADRAHTLKLMDRLANVARSIWPGCTQRSKGHKRHR